MVAPFFELKGVFMDTKKTQRKLPLIPLDDVLQCMFDKDEVVRKAAKTYYNQHYSNRLQNERLNN